MFCHLCACTNVKMYDVLWVVFTKKPWKDLWAFPDQIAFDMHPDKIIYYDLYSLFLLEFFSLSILSFLYFTKSPLTPFPSLSFSLLPICGKTEMQTVIETCKAFFYWHKHFMEQRRWWQFPAESIITVWKMDLILRSIARTVYQKCNSLWPVSLCSSRFTQI